MWLSSKAPPRLMVKVPWKPNSHGQYTASFTELVDMHPTIAALAGIPFTAPMNLGHAPDGPADAASAAWIRTEQAFGIDLSALFEQPRQAYRAVEPTAAADDSAEDSSSELLLKNASFSQWPSCGIPGG